MKKICEQCGKEFEVDVTKRNWQRKKLCSPECQKKHTNKNHRIKYEPIKWPQKKSCLHCGKEFLIHENGNMARKYCGDDCQLAVKADRALRKNEARRTTKQCPECGNAFMPGKYTAHKQIYCSLDCRKKAINKTRYASGIDGAKNRNTYKQIFREVRPQVLERDGNKCVICGSTEKLHAHHWDNSGGTEQANNNLSNLTTMCDVCHYAIHNITLVKIDGEWKLDGKIFELLGLNGILRIK